MDDPDKVSEGEEVKGVVKKTDTIHLGIRITNEDQIKKQIEEAVKKIENLNEELKNVPIEIEYETFVKE